MQMLQWQKWTWIPQAKRYSAVRGGRDPRGEDWPSCARAHPQLHNRHHSGHSTSEGGRERRRGTAAEEELGRKNAIFNRRQPR